MDLDCNPNIKYARNGHSESKTICVQKLAINHNLS